MRNHPILSHAWFATARLLARKTVRTTWIHLFMLLPLVLAPALQATAQSAQPSSQNAPLLQLGIGDELKFEVFGQPDMNSSLYIEDDGSVTIPLVGSVKIAGLSPTDAAKVLEQAIKDGNFLVNPHVTLTVVQTRSQRISVLGEVGAPGRYTVDSGTTIFDLLAQAGGVKADGGDVVYVLRPTENGQVTRYSISLRGLASNQFNQPFNALLPGDSVFVPKAEQFYIFGEVNKAGMYSMEPKMNVLEAIAKAGGITQRGSMNRVEIKRRVNEKKYRTLSASLTDPIEPDDVIQIKESIF